MMLTISKNKRLFILLTVVAVLLSIPFIAMFFTNEVNWNIRDFAVAGVILTGTVLAIEFIIRRVTKPNHRIILAMSVLFVLILFWMELAVGIFGSPLGGS